MIAPYSIFSVTTSEILDRGFEVLLWRCDVILYDPTFVAPGDTKLKRLIKII